ncbi:MAG: nucleotidyltransferase domain-containing protein [Actinobacteria bacterium]|nr:nucleotidyltransferase domain-containing protein [Actinomycetota bacterium]
MGTPAIRQQGLADALFTRVQQRVLGLLFSQPGRDFSVTEVIRFAEVGTGAVHRELARLVSSGLVTVTPMGRQKRYQANQDAPMFGELHGLILKTVGLAEPLREALNPLADEISVAFVYGSVAKGTDTAQSDVDLMVLSERLSYGDLFTALQEAEDRIGRRVNSTLLTVSDWRSRLAEDSHFVSGIAGQAKIFILGSENDLA